MVILLRNSLLFFLVLFSQIQLKAQDSESISPEDMLYSSYETNISFAVKNNQLVAEYSINKEVLYPSDKKTGLSTQSVYYSDYYSGDRKLEAFVYYPKKKPGKYKKKKVNDFYSHTVTAEGIFYEDLTRETCYYGELKQGCKTVLNFSSTINDPVLVPKILFNNELVTKEMVVRINVPKFVKVRLAFMGDSSGVKISATETATSTVYTYSCVNRESIVSEEDSPSIWYYVPHLIVIPVSYTHNSNELALAGTVDNLFNRYCKSIKEIASWDTTAIFALTDSLSKAHTDTAAKVLAIYNWVQNHIKYIAFEDAKSGFIPRAPDKVLKNRYGDCKDMATMLISMLNHTGIKAYHTWIGSRKTPYTYNQIPSPHCDDHMIAMIQLKGKWEILDATSPFNEMGYPSSFIQGKEAMIKLSDTDYKLYQVPVMPPRKSTRLDSLNLKISGNKITGTGTQAVSGYIKEDYKYFLKKSGKPDFKLSDKINIGNNKTLIKNIEVHNPKEIKDELKLTYEFELADYANFFNDEIYVNLNLIRDYDNDIIDTEKRKLDIESDYKFCLKEKICFEIPENTNVIKVPADQSFKDDLFSFDFKYKQNGRTLTLQKEIEINHLILKSSSYESWNKMIGQISKAYSEVVILKSIKK